MNINIEDVGQGIWFELHTESLRCCSIPHRKRVLIERIEEMRTNFFCLKCRGHIDLFCKKFPIQKRRMMYDENGNDISLFRWLWLLHNQVNKRLGKELVPFDEALDFWRDVINSNATCNTCSRN